MLLNVQWKTRFKQSQLKKQKTYWLKSASEKRRDRQTRWLLVDSIFMHSLGVQTTVFDHVMYIHVFLFCMIATDRCQFATDTRPRCY